MTTVGLIGAGHIGSTLAKAFVDHGYDVVVSNSRGPETLAELVAELGPKARAATALEAADAADIAVVTIPLKAIDSVPVEPLAGKIVIDTNNYYPQRDGQIAELDDESTTTAEMLQAHLPTSKVVKAFNHILYSQILTDATPAGTPGRRALAVVSDDADAAATVGEMIDTIGFDPVVVTPLSEGWRVQRDTPAYVTVSTADALREQMASAKRYRDM
jgi:predicted dinucleotide-binding enzyme